MVAQVGPLRRWRLARLQVLIGLCAGSGGGKDSKKQKTGDSSLPQSMLSSFLRKGRRSPPVPPHGRLLDRLLLMRAVHHARWLDRSGEVIESFQGREGGRCPRGRRGSDEQVWIRVTAAAAVCSDLLGNCRRPRSMLGQMKGSGIRRPAAPRPQAKAFSSSAYKVRCTTSVGLNVVQPLSTPLCLQPTSTRVHDMDEDIAFQAELGDLPEIQDMDTGGDDAAAAAPPEIASPSAPNVRADGVSNNFMLPHCCDMADLKSVCAGLIPADISHVLTTTTGRGTGPRWYGAQFLPA